jgi:choline dehydrogenase-like flavoprotein
MIAGQRPVPIRRELVMVGTTASNVVIAGGGGAAGCVVAAHLAESASRSLLLAEASPDLLSGLPGEFPDHARAR